CKFRCPSRRRRGSSTPRPFPPTPCSDRKAPRRERRSPPQVVCQKPVSSDCPHQSISRRRLTRLPRSKYLDRPAPPPPPRCACQPLVRRSGSVAGLPQRGPIVGPVRRARRPKLRSRQDGTSVSL